MYRHVLPYTVIEFRMYCLVPPCTEIDRKSTYWYVLLVIWRISVHTGMYQYIPSLRDTVVRIGHTHLESYTPGLWRYVPVRTGMYRLVLFYGTRRYLLGVIWRLTVHTSTYLY